LHATIDGRPVAVRGDELRIDELQARVVLELPAPARGEAK
jgi:hypothetical protein